MGKMEKPTTAFAYQALVMRSPDATGPDDAFVAVALPMDLVGVGPSPDDALETLAGCVEVQVEHAVECGDLGLVDFPAPEAYQAIARELRAAHLRGEAPDPERFVRSLPLPTAGGAAHRAA